MFSVRTGKPALGVGICLTRPPATSALSKGGGCTLKTLDDGAAPPSTLPRWIAARYTCRGVNVTVSRNEESQEPRSSALHHLTLATVPGAVLGAGVRRPHLHQDDVDAGRVVARDDVIGGVANEREPAVLRNPHLDGVCEPVVYIRRVVLDLEGDWHLTWVLDDLLSDRYRRCVCSRDVNQLHLDDGVRPKRDAARGM